MIAHKTFQKKVGGIFAGGASEDMEMVRGMAQQFINQTVGPENVLTITTEYIHLTQTFFITVWYRAKAQ